MAIKLDMSTAYDQVKWAYLKVIMRKIGFSERWISLIMMCVTSVSYEVLINGNVKGKSLHQGAYAKVTLFPLICSFFVQRGYLH